MSREFVMNMFPLSADSTLVMEVVNKISAAPEQIALSSMQYLFSYNALDAMKEIQIPFHLINCDKYPVNIEAGKRYITTFEVSIIPNVGHFLMMEDPESFNRVLEGIVIKYSADAI
jgi:pimeloyl-ACP methyl ester carboxylesterase